MIVTSTDLPGVLIIEPMIHRDHRGYFLETYHSERYRESANIPRCFVQDNLSSSSRHVLRGLHYQRARPQGKLITVLEGEIYDVALDIRPGSPSFGRWLGVILSSENYRQIFIPEGFAHGFVVLSTMATVFYKCTEYYFPSEERGIAWNDPYLSIEWPVTDPILSKKDSEYPPLLAIPEDELPKVSTNL